jgi:hypothetical protein
MAGIKGKSGGKREGSGRPSGINQKAISVKIDIDLIDYLNSKDNRNRFINDCIREKKNDGSIICPNCGEQFKMED